MAQVYGEGRVGAVVAHVLLPAVTAGLVLLARPRGTATAAWATALAAALLGPLLRSRPARHGGGAPSRPGGAHRRRALACRRAVGGAGVPWGPGRPRCGATLIGPGRPGLTSRVDETLEPWQLGLLQLAPDPQVWSIATVGAIAVLAVLGGPWRRRAERRHRCRRHGPDRAGCRPDRPQGGSDVGGEGWTRSDRGSVCP